MNEVAWIALAALVAIGMFAAVTLAERLGFDMPYWWRATWRARTGVALLFLGLVANLGLFIFNR